MGAHLKKGLLPSSLAPMPSISSCRLPSSLANTYVPHLVRRVKGAPGSLYTSS